MSFRPPAMPLVFVSMLAYAVGMVDPSKNAFQPDIAQRLGFEVVREHREFSSDASIPQQDSLATPGGVWVRDDYASVQVNVDENGLNIVGDAANEPSIAVDPSDPRRIVIGWRQFDNVLSNFREAGWAYSQDAGHTWTFPGSLRPGEFASDPVVDVDRAGNFFYYSLQPDRGPGSWACYLYKSLDGGVTWPQETYANGGDKAWITVDRTAGMGAGHVYATWGSRGCCSRRNLTRSIDGGLSFPETYDPSFPSERGSMSVGPDGALILASVSGRYVSVTRSENAQDPNAIPDFNLRVAVDIGGEPVAFDGPNPGGLLGQVWVATDHSEGASRGNVYLLASVDPPGGDPLDVMFVRSVDGGETWNDPVRINDDAIVNGAWQWFGTMAVAPNGRIDVIWNDTRRDPSGAYSELYYAFSLDAGTTWSKNVAVSLPYDHSAGYPRQAKLGDYYGMVSDNLGANVAYAATFNDEQDIYFLRIGPHDCNNNGVDDIADVLFGTSYDCDGNVVPDECDRDCDGDGVPDACDPPGDADGDGVDDCTDECPRFAPPQPCVCPDVGECCFPGGECMIISRASCVDLGGEPDCQEAVCHRGCPLGDFNHDGRLDLVDVARFTECFTGGDSSPTAAILPVECQSAFDFDDSNSINLRDFSALQPYVAGP